MDGWEEGVGKLLCGQEEEGRERRHRTRRGGVGGEERHVVR